MAATAAIAAVGSWWARSRQATVDSDRVEVEEWQAITAQQGAALSAVSTRLAVVDADLTRCWDRLTALRKEHGRD